MAHQYKAGDWLDNESSYYFRYILATLPDSKYKILAINKINFKINISIGTLFAPYTIINIETKITRDKLNELKAQIL